MENLNENINTISEDVAEGLIKAFEEINQSAKELEETIKGLNKAIGQELARQVVEKFLCYVEKHTNASIITRWYWKRKAFKMAQAVREASTLLDEKMFIEK